MQGFGLGLRPVHYPEIFSRRPAVDWFEIISENFMEPGGPPLANLERVRADFPIVLHGVSLGIGNSDPLDDSYLDDLARLIDRIDPDLVSDHLCWTRHRGLQSHDLLPLPYTEEVLAHVAERTARVQDRLGLRLLLENPSSYLQFAEDEMPEWEFLAELAARTDCRILLDVNNVYVSSVNHGFDPLAYFAALPPARIAQIHLAGHSRSGDLLIDTHDQPVCEAVWNLYAVATRLFPGVPAMIERDGHIPPLAELEAELDRARWIAADKQELAA